jgi:hypothetical protein
MLLFYYRVREGKRGSLHVIANPIWCYQIYIVAENIAATEARSFADGSPPPLQLIILVG